MFSLVSSLKSSLSLLTLPDVFSAGLWVQMMGILGGSSVGATRLPQKG